MYVKITAPDVKLPSYPSSALPVGSIWKVRDYRYLNSIVIHIDGEEMLLSPAEVEFIENDDIPTETKSLIVCVKGIYTPKDRVRVATGSIWPIGRMDQADCAIIQVAGEEVVLRPSEVQLIRTILDQPEVEGFESASFDEIQESCSENVGGSE